MDRHHQNITIDAAVCVAALPPITDMSTAEEFAPLWNGVRTWLKFKPRDHRDVGIHPSALGKWCSKERAFSTLQFLSGEKIPLAKIDPSFQMYFEAGHAAHHHWQNHIFGAMKILEGRWQCSNCGKMHGDHHVTIVKPSVCSSCAAPEHRLMFMEPRAVISAAEILGVPEETLSDEEKRIYAVSGHCDGIFRLRGFGRMVAELKSEKSSNWESRTSPNPEHILQGQVYAHSLGLDQTIIVYIQKDTYAIKSFLVKGVAKTISWLYGEVRTIYSALKNKTTYKLKGVCTDKDCTRAKVCPFRSVCF